MTIRIVVADRGEARFYDMHSPKAALQLAGQLVDENAQLHDRDFMTDRPGRVFDHAPPATTRRGAVAHHGVGGEREPRKIEAERFARRIADELDAARKDGVDRIVLMAGPSFLGTLRTALSKGVRDKIVAEIPKDLVHEEDDDALRSHITRQMFV